MYRISQDPRVEKSAKKITDGFEACLAKKKLNDITISEICLSAHVGRTTFYRLFDNPIDVLQYLVDKVFCQYYGRIELDDKIAAQKTLIQSLQAMMECSHILDAVLINDRIDVLYQAYLKCYHDPHIDSEQTADMSKQDRDYFLYHISTIAAVYLRVWDKYGKSENAETLYQHIKNDCLLLSNIFSQ